MPHRCLATWGGFAPQRSLLCGRTVSRRAAPPRFVATAEGLVALRCAIADGRRAWRYVFGRFAPMRHV